LAGGIEENHENLDRMTGFLAETWTQDVRSTNRSTATGLRGCLVTWGETTRLLSIRSIIHTHNRHISIQESNRQNHWFCYHANTLKVMVFRCILISYIHKYALLTPLNMRTRTDSDGVDPAHIC
jgi:hypothetical protein